MATNKAGLIWPDVETYRLERLSIRRGLHASPENVPSENAGYGFPPATAHYPVTRRQENYGVERVDPFQPRRKNKRYRPLPIISRKTRTLRFQKDDPLLPTAGDRVSAG